MAPSVQEFEEWQTITEVATELEASRVSVYRWVHEGRLRSASTHAGVLVEPASVQRVARERGRRETPAQRERRATQYINELDHGAPR